jgi:hypothetical protein
MSPQSLVIYIYIYIYIYIDIDIDIDINIYIYIYIFKRFLKIIFILHTNAFNIELLTFENCIKTVC